MLHHNGDIRFDQACIVSVVRNRFGILQLVEAEMLRPFRRNRHGIGTDGLTIRKVDCDLHVCVLFRRIQQAGGLMAGKLRLHADGFSCKEQIAQETNRHALHLAEVLQIGLHSETSDQSVMFPEKQFVNSRKAAQKKSMVRAGLITLAALAFVAAGLRRCGENRIDSRAPRVRSYVVEMILLNKRWIAIIGIVK